MKYIRTRSLAALAAMAMLAGPVWSEDIEHVHLGKSNELTFDAILEEAMLQSPAYREIAVRSQQAEDFEAVGKSWIAGLPSAQLEYVDDGDLSSSGYNEVNYGIALPLWRLGERDNMQALGESYTAQANEWQRRFKLDTAGKLRASLANLHEAQTLLRVEQQATEDAKELLRISEVLFNAGETAELDVLQARSLLLAQQGNELAADAAMVDAERNYNVLTGLTVAPLRPHTETLIVAEEVPAEHPLLLYLQSTINLQDASVRRLERIAKGSPTLTVGGRRQQANFNGVYEDALTLSVSVPFGGKSFSGVAGSYARRAKVSSEVQYFTAQRELNAQLHEVEHQLFTIGERLPLSEEQATLAQRQWDMARSAFELGETDIGRVIEAMQQARATAKQFEVLSMQYQRLITEFNQIIGVVP